MKKSFEELEPVASRQEVRFIDGKLQALERRLVEITQRYEQVCRPSDPQSDVDRLVDEPQAQLAPSVGEAAELREKESIAAAIARLKADRQRIIGSVSTQVCRDFASHYKDVVLRVLEAARELSRANQAVSTLFDSLTQKGYESGTLRFMGFVADEIGSLNDPNSFISAFERECSEYGFLPAGLVGGKRK